MICLFYCVCLLFLFWWFLSCRLVVYVVFVDFSFNCLLIIVRCFAVWVSWFLWLFYSVDCWWLLTCFVNFGVICCNCVLLYLVFVLYHLLLATCCICECRLLFRLWLATLFCLLWLCLLCDVLVYDVYWFLNCFVLFVLIVDWFCL